MSDLGDKIRIGRKWNKITQEELAKLVGVSVMTIRRYESGERKPPKEILRKIANIFDVPFMVFFGDIKCAEVEFATAHMNRLSHIADALGKKAEELQRSVVPMIDIKLDTRFRSITENYSQLNEAGKDNLAKYAKNLTYVPEYTRFDNETPPQSGEGQEAKEGQ